MYRNGNASKPYPNVRTPSPRDYDDPNADDIVPPNRNKDMSMDSDTDALPSKIIWKIDSENFSAPLEPVNDYGTHWSITLTQPT
ncbi:hypothetical protein JOM56_006635, partial [Amanita muscaria]